MENTFKFFDKTLMTQSFELSFNYNIEKVILYDEVFVVLLSVTDKNGRIFSSITNNVYGVNIQGELLWRIGTPIDVPTSITNSDEGEKETQEMFTGINLSTDGVFSAITFSSMRYIINYRTGELQKKEAMRW